MIKLLMFILFMGAIHEAMASNWIARARQVVTGLAGQVVGEVVVNIYNNTDYEIRVAASDSAEGMLSRAGTLISKGVSGDGLTLGAHKSGSIVLTKKDAHSSSAGRGDTPALDNAIVTIGAKYASGTPFFTFCKISAEKSSHTLRFKSDGGLLKHLKCHDES